MNLFQIPANWLPGLTEEQATQRGLPAGVKTLPSGVQVRSAYDGYIQNFKTAYENTSSSYPDYLRNMFAQNQIADTLEFYKQFGAKTPEDLKNFYSGTTFNGINFIIGPDGNVVKQWYDELSDKRGATFKDFVRDTSLALLSAGAGGPFAQTAIRAYQVYNAAKAGDILGAAAGVAGIGGYEDAASALAGVRAIQNEDPLGLLYAVGSSSYGNSTLGDTGITIKDAATATGILDNINKGNYGTALANLGSLVNSPDVVLAGRAANLVQALESNNPLAISNAVFQLTNVVDAASKKGVNTTAPAPAPIVVGGNDSVVSGVDTVGGGVSNDTVGGGVGNDTVGGVFDFNPTEDELIAKQQKQDAANLVYKDFLSGKTDDAALRQAMATAGYTPDQITNQIQLGNAIKAGSDLTSSEQTLQDVWSSKGTRAWIQDQVNAQSSFGAAFSKARELLGPGQTFTYGDKTYNTFTRDELTRAGSATQELQNASTFDVNLMKTPLAFDASNGTTARLLAFPEFTKLMKEANVDEKQTPLEQRYQAYLIAQSPRVAAGQRIALPIELAYTIPPSATTTFEEPVSQFDTFKSTVLSNVAAGQQKASYIQNIINSYTTAGLGLVGSIGAGLNSIATQDAYNSFSTNLRNLANISNSTSDVLVPDLAAGAYRIGNAVEQANGFWNKAKALGNGLLENPGAAFWWAGKEGSQQYIPMLGAAKVLQATGSMKAAAGANALWNFIENTGVTKEELIEDARRQGLDPNQISFLTDRGAMGAGVVGSILETALELPFIKKYVIDANKVGTNTPLRTGLKNLGEVGLEAPKGGLEEYGTVAGKNLAMTGNINDNEALTAMVLGGWLQSSAKGGFTTLDAAGKSDLFKNFSFDVLQQTGEDGIPAVINEALKNGVELKDVLGGIAEGTFSRLNNPDAAESLMANQRLGL